MKKKIEEKQISIECVYTSGLIKITYLDINHLVGLFLISSFLSLSFAHPYALSLSICFQIETNRLVSSLHYMNIELIH